MSQEQLADQVVRTSEEKHKLTVELEAAHKVRKYYYTVKHPYNLHSRVRTHIAV